MKKYLPQKIYDKAEQNRWNLVSPCYATENGAEIMQEDMIDFIIFLSQTNIQMDGKDKKDFTRDDFVRLYRTWSEKGGRLWHDREK